MKKLHKVRFYRNLENEYSGSSGGNVKHRDYFEHVKHSPVYDPTLYFSPATKWYDNPVNVWNQYREIGLPEWTVNKGDILLFSGKDWQVLSESERIDPPVPVINIAHPRHSFENDPRRPYLQHPAIRIAKSHAGAAILREYGVNGPLYVIPDNIDLSELPPPVPKSIDILIVGLKQPELAKQLYRALKWRNLFRWHKWKIHVQLPPKLPKRQDFFNLVNQSKVAIYLPLGKKRGFEGFFLPPLEGMAMNTLAIVPDCIGNRDYSQHGINCMMPNFSKESIMHETIELLRMPEEQRERMRKAGQETAKKHALNNERSAFLELLHNAENIWRTSTDFLDNKEQHEVVG